jgi:hypothetical protein
MSTEDARNLALIAVIAVAPLAIVMIFALLRGYTIDLHMTRDMKRGFRRRRSYNDPDDPDE